ncbi:MAG: molybdopterin molybdotransferase MoeA [Gammaproteobacteria bacterium]|nr:molybdopterin molybdotransferase MoeA [Gammaproteobacteria bacterium]
MNDSSCRSEFDTEALSVEQARERILDSLHPVPGEQRLALREALGRVLAADVHARIDVPPQINSAMDGYALRHEDLAAATGLRIIGTSWAGKPCPKSVSAGEAVRIMTGAVVPEGADTVVMQEEAEVDGRTVRVRATPVKGEFVRRPGDDVARGAVVLRAGKRLGAAEIGLLASQGYVEARVRRRVRAAFFSTGDELVGVGKTLASGQIYDSNRYTLYGLLHEQGVETIDLGVVEDNREALSAAFTQASNDTDVIITTGGVSVGDADFVKSVLREQGSVNFWKIAMRPGRPLTFGRVGDSCFFGLPGNPVSVAVTFAQLVAPALAKLSGTRIGEALRLQVPTLSRLTKAPGRRDFQRGILLERDGIMAVQTTGMQGSHVLSGMSDANCYIVLPEQCSEVNPGDIVDVLPFSATY